MQFEKYRLNIDKNYIHIGPPPIIDIGVSPTGTEIMKDGKFNDGILINHPNYKFPISRTISTFEIFLSNPKAHEKLVHMRDPTIVYNEQELTTIFRGQLAKGGNLTSSPQSFSIIFACAPINKSSSDVQITLHFDDHSYINLFFNKECNTIEGIQEYFTILYIIYWILIVLIITFMVALFFYYLKKNELSIIEFYDKIREYVYEKVDYYKRRRNYNESENRSLINSKMVEEDDIDFKITSSAASDKDKNFKSSAFEYGGI